MWDAITNTFAIFVTLLSIVASIASLLGAWRAYQARKSPLQGETLPLTEKEAKTTYQIEPTDTGVSRLIVFESAKQRDVLKINGRALQCYLSDFRNNKFSGLEWTLSKSEAQNALSHKEIRVDPGLKPTTGTFTIGDHPERRYSKKLYPNPKHLEKELYGLVEAMLNDNENL